MSEARHGFHYFELKTQAQLKFFYIDRSEGPGYWNFLVQPNYLRVVDTAAKLMRNAPREHSSKNTCGAPEWRLINSRSDIDGLADFTFEQANGQLAMLTATFMDQFEGGVSVATQSLNRKIDGFPAQVALSRATAVVDKAIWTAAWFNGTTYLALYLPTRVVKSEPTISVEEMIKTAGSFRCNAPTQ